MSLHTVTLHGSSYSRSPPIPPRSEWHDGELLVDLGEDGSGCLELEAVAFVNRSLVHGGLLLIQQLGLQAPREEE